MRGDLCPYDHGLDPVIVEDVNLPNVLSFPHGHGMLIRVFSFTSTIF